MTAHVENKIKWMVYMHLYICRKKLHIHAKLTLQLLATAQEVKQFKHILYHFQQCYMYMYTYLEPSWRCAMLIMYVS